MVKGCQGLIFYYQLCFDTAGYLNRILRNRAYCMDPCPLALGGVAACHAGSNLVNDYYDHLSTNDDINEYRSPFNGGSGCIQEGIVAPLSMRNAGLLCYFISIVFGIILSSLLNIWGLLLVLLGIAFGFSYSRFPGLSYYGLGELMVGISFGPLIVAVSIMPKWIYIPFGCCGFFTYRPACSCSGVHQPIPRL